MKGPSVYDQLLRLADRESELIRTGAWDELVDADRERRALVAQLPDDPPEHARGPLLRIHALLAHNASAIGAAMAQTQGELDRIVRARRTLRTYSQSAQPQLDFRG